MTRKEVGIITGLFLVWRLGLFGLALFAGKILPYAPSFPYATTLLPSFGLPQWIYSFANFDGVHYLTIAHEGYLHTNFIQAFFPLFPFVILHGLFQLIPSLNLLAVGLLVSNMAFLGTLLLGYDLIRRMYSTRIAWRFLIALLLFPWSIFFASVYTESIFVFLTVICFWLAFHKRWYVAGLVTMALSASRIVGVIMVPALWIELYRSGDRDWKSYFAVTAGSLGLLAYMMYLYVHFADPVYFLHVQAAFGAGRSNTITLYPQVAYRSLKILLTTTKNLKYVTYMEEFVAGTLGVLAILMPLKKIPPGITFFALATVLIPSISGSFLSMGRFLLPALPIYILTAFIASRHPKLGYLWYALSGGILILNSILFLQGYWVA